MSKKRKEDTRRASRKLKELLRDKPFGVGAGLAWIDPQIGDDDWTDESADDVDDYVDWYADDEEAHPLDIN
tara:strand:- start:74635 stop:74847 length:213 start_codon:yes stop_codon:yes gene_type:complete